MAKKPQSSATSTPATSALAAAGVAYTAHPYHHDPAVTDYGREAAEALGISADRVFKTLIVQADARLAVAVLPVSSQLDLKAFAAALGAKKAELAPVDLAQKRTGYLVGGVSPVGQKVRLETVVDEAALSFDTVFVSGGKRGLDIELAPAELVAVTDARVGVIRRG